MHIIITFKFGRHSPCFVPRCAGLTVEEYRNEMQDLVDHVRETKQHVEEFGEVAKKALEATDESGKCPKRRLAGEISVPFP